MGHLPRKFLCAGLGMLWLVAGAGCNASGRGQPHSPPQVEGAPPTVTAAPPASEPAPGHRLVYVPAYSHLFQREGRRTMLGVTLSIHNIDVVRRVTLHKVDYFDTDGTLVRRYLPGPRELGPLATAEFMVTAQDDAGGSGANFLVEWSGPKGARALLTETIMVGHAGGGYLSFTSRGVELETEARPH